VLTLQTNNHTSPKTAPGPPPPRQPRTRAATAIAPATCLTIVTRKVDGTMQTSVKSCARGYLDVQVGVETAQMTTCRGRGGVWSAIRVEGGAGEGWSSHLFSRLVAVTASQYARPRRGKGSRGGNPSLACHTRQLLYYWRYPGTRTFYGRRRVSVGRDIAFSRFVSANRRSATLSGVTDQVASGTQRASALEVR
jgi:hypothetical protein